GAMAAQVVGGDLRVILEHHDCRHRLLPLWVITADDGCVCNLGVPQQHLLYLGRNDVLTATDDQIVDPVAYIQETFIINVTQIPGVQPTIGIRAAWGNGWALDENLAVLDPQVRGEQRTTSRA